MRYAIITPKNEDLAPKNTRHGWAFPYNSAWHPIGPEHPYPEELAEHARAFFTVKQDSGEATCSVEIEYFEGEVALQVVQPALSLACPLCDERFTEMAPFSEHVKACAAQAKSAPSPAEKRKAGE